MTELTGRVLQPGDPGWDGARRGFAKRANYDANVPRAIVFCQDTQDVVNAIAWSKENKAPVRIRSGRHLYREALFIRTQQRNGTKGQGRSSNGTATKSYIRAQVNHGQLSLDSMPDEDAPTRFAPGQVWDFSGEQHTWFERVLMLRYRWAARIVLAILPDSKRDSVKTVTFGHTHMPDRYEFPGGKVYVNSGDWCGHTTHQCYSVIHKDGFVSGPFQWDSVAVALQRGHL